MRVTVNSVQIMSTVVPVVDSVRDLGVVLVSHLTMSAQVSSVLRSAFYQLRQLRPVVRSLTTDAAKMVIQAFVSLRLDYCNSLFYGISDRLIICDDYKRFRTLRHVSLRVRGGATYQPSPSAAALVTSSPAHKV